MTGGTSWPSCRTGRCSCSRCRTPSRRSRRWRSPSRSATRREGTGRVGRGGDAEHTADMTSPATAPGAERTRELWSAGDYQRVGVRLGPASEQLVAGLPVRPRRAPPGSGGVPASEQHAADLQARPGERLLDIGGGTGNTALAAARRDADVVCTDIVPELLDYARRRAEMEGLAFGTEVADAQALPYEDESFDVVPSTIGVVFAADAERAAGERGRGGRPGGG